MNRLQKFVITGALVLAPVLSVGAASAAPAVVTINSDNVNAIAQKYGVVLSTLLKGSLNLSNANVYWGATVLKYPFQGSTGYNNGKPASGKGQASTAPGHTNSGTPSGNTAGGSSSSNQGTPAGSTSGNVSNSGNTQNNAGTGTTSSDSASYASQVVDLVNQERTKAGLKPLTSDSSLTNVALVKAKDMYTNNYFDHTSPTYGSPFDMMKSFGISYTYAGENIAKGQRNPQEVMTAWMNSQGHRENILSPNYTKIGVAYYNGEWVQEFIAN